MGRRKKQLPESDAEADTENPGTGHNSALTDDQRAALHFRHVRDYGVALAAKKATDADFKNTCKAIKAEGGSVAKIKRTIQLSTPEGEEKFRAELAELEEVAKWSGVGVQIDMFADERQPAIDKAFADGKRAGLKGEPASPMHAPETEQYRAWLSGHGEGQAVLAKGFSTIPITLSSDESFDEALEPAAA